MKTIATLALAGIALAAFLPAGSARADDCLLDTNNDGNADSNVDTDLAADSGGDDARLACGSGASAGSTGSVALGRNATTSSGGVANNIISSSINTAVGNSSFAIGSSNTALGAFARAATYDQSNADLGTVVGAIAVGNNALAGADATVAIGRNANSTGTSSTSVGAFANALVMNTTAIGWSSSATFTGSTAVGSDASAAGSDAVALGASAQAQATSSLAIGAAARSTAEAGVAIGGDSSADGANTEGARAGLYAVALGTDSIGTGISALAIGSFSDAIGNYATGIGYDAYSGGNNSTAIGSVAFAPKENATAIGSNAWATHEGSTAIGTGARTTAQNQVMLGATGTAVVVADIASSTAAQQGPVNVVTVDANGVLGRQAAVASASQVAAVQYSVAQIAAVSDAQFDALSGRVGALESGFDALSFRLDDVDRNANAGIAAAMALGGTMVVPDSTVSVSFNAATYRGEQGFSGSIVARVAPRVYVSGGVAGSTAKKSTGGRVGVAFGL